MNKAFYFKLLSILLISIVGIIAYSNTFHCSFHLDDQGSITDNFAIRNISDLPGIWDFWPCRFITYLTIALNYHFSGLDVTGYHIFNLMVHLLSAILVWWFVLLTLSTPAMLIKVIEKSPVGKKSTPKGKSTTVPHAELIALFAGLIFVSHPLQSQAVTYIVQRATSMATLFYLATLCFYIKSRLLEKRGYHYYILSLITAFIAMFIKEMTITLPLMIMLYEFSFLKRDADYGISIKYLAPFLFILLTIPVTMSVTNTVDFQDMHRIVEGPTGITSTQYLLTQFRVIFTYIRLLFLPINQNLDYDYHISNSLFELPTILSLLFLIVILYLAKRLFSKYRLTSFSIFWFFLALLPESSIVPIKDVIFEHRLYLPMVGYSMFLVSGIYYSLCCGDTLKGVPTIRIVSTMCVVLTLIIACNSVLTYQRNKVWKDEFTLWNDTVRKSPHKARPYNNRGNAYAGLGDLTRALSDYNKAIGINPDIPELYNNRGFFYSKHGNLTRAMSDYNKAIKLNPHSDVFYYNRGVDYHKQGDLPQAISDYNKALELNPHYAEAYNNRGNAFEKQGDLTQALSDINRAIEIDPDYKDAINNRADIYEKQGDSSQAMAEYNKAIERDPKDAQAYNDRGNLENKQGDLTQAVADYTKSIELNPKFAGAYYNRGSIYGRQGNLIQAVSDLSRAIELVPDYSEAYDNRAVSYFMLKEYDKAWADALKAQKLGADVSPGFLKALKASRGSF